MTDFLLSRLTLVIPTYKRQLYALRNMRYWSGRGATVHVLDGSPLAISEYELSGLAGNIHYHHLPLSLFERFKFSLGLIETEYTALMGDDEFFIPSALEACIRELESQAELVSCMGRCILFGYTTMGITGQTAYMRLENYSILQDDPVDRMVAHMDPYVCSTIYSVVRSRVWQRSILTLVQKEFPAFAIGEYQFELAVCYQGKSKVIPELMWLRSAETPAIRGKDLSLMPENTALKWWLDPAMEIEHSEFLTIMGTTLAATEDKVAEVASGVKMAFDAFVKGRLNMPSINKTQNLMFLIIQYLPAQLKTILNSIRRPLFKFFFNIDIKPLIEAAKDLADTRVKVDFEELSNIQSLISAFHSNKHTNSQLKADGDHSI
jgi:glycosyltransferase domain-containing protein